MSEEVADFALKESMELLNRFDIEQWNQNHWQKWGEFVIITKKTKSDALSRIDSEYQDFFKEIERYFDVLYPKEEKERLFHQPSTFNKSNYRMGSPQHANFVEPGIKSIVGFCHLLHLLLYESFEKIELQRKGIVGMIKQRQELEEQLKKYKEGSGLSVTYQQIAIDEQQKKEVPKIKQKKSDVEEDLVEELREKLKKQAKTIAKLREKTKKQLATQS